MSELEIDSTLAGQEVRYRSLQPWEAGVSGPRSPKSPARDKSLWQDSGSTTRLEKCRCPAKTSRPKSSGQMGQILHPENIATAKFVDFSPPLHMGWLVGAYSFLQR
jgi:hypothetical protein